MGCDREKAIEEEERVAATYTYAQQLLVDCLKELHRIDPEQNDYDGNYIFDVEKDIELALEHLL